MQVQLIDYVRGAGVATDLVNTASVVRRSTGEVLTQPAELGRFLAERDLHLDVLADGRDPTTDELQQVYALRQQVAAILETSSPDATAEGANALVERAGTGPFLQRDPDGTWQWYVATTAEAALADELAVLIGTGLLGVLRTLGHERFRPCASPECEGRFVDTSRAGRRRYCMPELCGNRLNVANHRARRQAAAGD